MTTAPEVRPLESDAEFQALLSAEYQSFFGFGQPASVLEGWLDWIGRDNLRVLVQDGQVVGGLGLLHFGQYFGGRSVPSVGISVVAVVPEVRGTGAGKHLMQQTVRQMAADGAPLSVLYPSTWAFYRHAGYEPAGARTTYEFNLRRLGATDTTCRLRRIGPEERRRVEPIYEQFACHQTGLVARTRMNWQKIFKGEPEDVFTYLVEGPAGPSGYLVYTHQEVPDKPYRIDIRDLVWLDESAGRRILAFLHQHGVLGESVRYDGAPVDPLLALSRVENQKIRYNHYWMLRMLDARAALTGRGYPAGVAGELHFELEDPLLEQNRGRFVLRVRDGQGEVADGGTGQIRLGPRGLAPLYTGHLPPEDLRRMGLLEADDASCGQAAAIFSGPRPWMCDRF